MLWVFSYHKPSSACKVGCICDLKAQRYSVRNKKATRELQEGWPVTFCLKDQYLASFSRLSFEYEERSLIIAKIQRYCTAKNAPFLSHSDLDLKEIDPFLYGSIPFIIMYQYQYVVQPDRLNYGTIGTCLRKWLCLSMTDCEGTTTGLKRKWRQLYMKSFEKKMNFIPRQCEMKIIIEEPSPTGNLNKIVIHSLFTCYFVNTPRMLNGGSILYTIIFFFRNPYFVYKLRLYAPSIRNM